MRRIETRARDWLDVHAPSVRAGLGYLNAARWAAAKRIHAYRNREENAVLGRISGRLLARSGGAVIGGPFGGMLYDGTAFGSVAPAKIVGSYEAELHDVVSSVVDAGYERILDLGAAEGYYAVGLARACPDAHVIAFDTAREARKLCRALASSNGARVTVRGGVNARELGALAHHGSLVICDVEGAERGLLDPDAAQNLQGCDLLVELHDHLDPEITAVLSERFRQTHEIRVFEQRPRIPSDWAGIEELSAEEQRAALDERRARQQRWAWMRRRAGLAGSAG